ncbi:MAG: efflux RND transporter permease subunit [Thermoguttaceae bacterium]|nr:efflux RND transporter permease subunit [Thermoguttaceae bacterium]
MSLWDLCIKRPVFTVMLVSAPIVLGLVGRSRLGVDLLPNVEIPVVVVTTTLKGASVEEMETSVTKPLEEIINTVSGICEMPSLVVDRISQIVVQFVLEKDRDVAAQEVRDKISTVLARLPVGTDNPIIDKFDFNASPVIQIAVAAPRPMQEITEIARKQIKENIETIPGVGAVIIVGGRQRAVNIYIDADKLTAYHLSIEDVRSALLRQNLELPGGRVDQGTRELVLRTMGRVETTAGFLDLIVANQRGYPVRIRDIGRVVDSFEEPRGLARLDGRNAVSLIVQKQSGSNTVQVVDLVQKRLAELGEVLPPDVETMVVKDQSKFIRLSIHELNFHLVIAAVLVALTIMLFIRDWRTTIIASLAIPASIITTFAFMYWMGYTLNNMTMLGLILAIGIVIDDAVVINENIFRHMEEHGYPALKAAATATREIALAVSATTLSLLVIFLPVVFMGGRVGRFFSSFGATVAFAILMSWFVSFTMTPMLCSRFLKLKKGHAAGSKESLVWRAIDRTYGWILGWSLRHRWVIVATSVALLISTVLLFRIVGFDFLPRDDQSEFEVAITLPEGYTLDRADQVFREIEARIAALHGVTHVFSTIGDTTGRVSRGQGDVTSGMIYARLVDLEERTRKWYDPQFWIQGIFRTPEPDPRYFSQFDVQRAARAIMAEYPELRSAVQDSAVVSGAGFRMSMIDLNLRGPDLARLQEYSEKIMAWMRQHPEYVDIDTSLSLRKPELRVKIDRERASDLGIPVQTIASTLNVLVGGEPVTKYKELDEQYDVWLRAELAARDRSEAIERLMVPSPKAGLVQLASLASLEPARGPATIDRFGMQRQVVITANLEGGKALGDAVRDLSQFVDSMNLPADYHYEFIGRAKAMGESNQNFLIAFLTAFLFMYMILAAQFESFVHPITILLALPLTLPFALVSLILLRTNLNLYAMFGLFMLFGIVKKNGILQVDYTNVLRQRGLPRDEAILEANHTRLRPILMTTVMLIAAMIPIALGQGPGAASRASLAKVILGGQTLSLLLTLLVTPVAYSLWDDLSRFASRLAGRFVREEPEEEEAPGELPAEGEGEEERVIEEVA